MGALLAVLAALIAAIPAGGAAKPTCLGEKATIVGTGGPDALKGTRKGDVIVAKAGDDDINAKAGKDRICGGSGDDVLNGGRAKDRFDGGDDIDDCLTVAGESATGCEPQLIDVEMEPTSVVAGQSAEMTVTLEDVAPPGGLSVSASTDSPSRSSVAPTIMVPAGSDSASTEVETVLGDADQVSLTGGLGRRQLSANLALTRSPPFLQEFTLHATCANVVGQADYQVGIVKLNRHAESDTTITVGSGDQNVATMVGGGQVTIAQGNILGVVGLNVLTEGTTTLSASLGAQPPISHAFEARDPGSPVTLVSLDLNPATVVGGGPSSTGTVFLDCASDNPVSVDLSKSGAASGQVSIPPSLFIPAGEQFGTFNVGTTAGTGGQATISATLSPVTLNQNLTITE